jgi:Questin oxidase-like
MSAAELLPATALEPRGLADLVERSRGYSVEFDPWMANHLPMGLVILDRLGADQSRLESWFETYASASRLKPVPAGAGRIDVSNWDRHLGERALEADFRTFFTGEARRLGGAEAQRRYLPTLVPGIAASALHALMRLAYGNLTADPAEIGTALGYWACTFLPLRPADAVLPRTDDPASLLLALRQAPSLCRLEPETDLLWHWMRTVAAAPAFPDVAALLAPAPDLLARVARVSLALMAGTMSFETLHAVTSAHWIRLVRPCWPDETLAVRYLWQAVAALYPKIGMPELPTPDQLAGLRELPCPDWPEIRSHAIASDDEHDLSFTFTAMEEQRQYGDRLYQVLASRRLGLIG